MTSDLQVTPKKYAWWQKVLAILGASFITTMVLLYGGQLCHHIASWLNVPLKWVVLALVSLVFTLVITAMQEGHLQPPSTKE